MKNTTPPQTKIAVTLDNGTTAIMSFVTSSRSPTLPQGARWVEEHTGLWERPATDANIFAEITKTFRATDNHGLPLPQPVRYKVVDEAEIPTDRTYRNALRHSETGFAFDLDTAKALHLTMIREARVESLNALDTAWMKATGQKDQVAADAVEAKRQTLRDLPTTIGIEKATTIDELKALWPVELARP